MGEIRSPYFSIDQEHLKDNAEIRSPYFSSGGEYYLGVNAEIRSPYFSFDTQDYHGDNAGIHSSYFSAADYHGEDLEAGAVHKIGKNLNDGCIYRVPGALRKSNKAIYTPQEVSIGPIHHDKKNLQPMNTQKQRYLKEFCNRVVGETKVQHVKFREKIWNTINDEVEKIRRYYEDGSHEVAENDRFVNMVMLDAVFILEYLLRNKNSKKYGDDSLLRRNGLRFRIRQDFLLLENQLPFFILEKLYAPLLEEGEGNYTSFRELASKYLNRYNADACKLIDYNELDQPVLHFTDLVRSSLSVNHPPLRSDEPIGKFYSATKLHEAAINFKEFRNECLLNVKFSSTKGELRIPRLRIDGNTELLFGNLIALEQCRYKGEDQYICHYVKLLDTLVAKPKDVDLLIKNKIIDTDRDGASVKNLIERLSAETSEEYSIYYSLYKQLDQHYQNSWLKNSAYFREVYFGNLWRSTATVSAAVLLLFTFVQTICAVVALRANTPSGPS